MELITHRDLGDENDFVPPPMTHLPATITTLKGTKIYPPANGTLYIIKRKGHPAHHAWCMEDALETARHLEGAMS